MEDYLALAGKVLLASAAVGVLTVVGQWIYNIWFHPLKDVPGPLLGRMSYVWYASKWLGGRYARDIQELHQQYGSTVRYGPNALSFSTLQSYKDIYGHASKGREPFRKGLWYRSFNVDGKPGLASETDIAVHRQDRRDLAHAFSAAALREQTYIARKYIDQFVSQVTRFGQTDNGISVDEWFMWLTFDVIGDLAFGEPFGAVEKAQSDFWIDMVLDSAFALSFVQILSRLPALWLVAPIVLPSDLQSKAKRHKALTTEKINRRIADTDANNRLDFFAHLLKNKSQDHNADFFMTNANTIITAGSETTATFLAAVTFFLLDNPHTLKALQEEVRPAFATTETIDQDSTAVLPYLTSVIEEGLRLFPPVSFGLERESPGAVVDGMFVPADVTVSTATYTVSHSADYFHDPNKFHPERWLPSNHPLYNAAFANDVKDASKPFSIGPRMCIGINLAYLEMRITLAKMVWHFDWELKSQNIDWVKDTRMTMLWKKPKVNVKYTPIKKKW